MRNRDPNHSALAPNLSLPQSFGATERTGTQHTGGSVVQKEDSEIKRQKSRSFLSALQCIYKLCNSQQLILSGPQFSHM